MIARLDAQRLSGLSPKQVAQIREQQAASLRGLFFRMHGHHPANAAELAQFGKRIADQADPAKRAERHARNLAVVERTSALLEKDLREAERRALAAGARGGRAGDANAAKQIDVVRDRAALLAADKASLSAVLVTNRERAAADDAARKREAEDRAIKAMVEHANARRGR